MGDGTDRGAKGEEREAPATTSKPDCLPPTACRNAADDLTVLQQILWLRGGQLDNFHPIQPPAVVRRFLRTATLGQLQGLLVEGLAKMRDEEEIQHQ